MLLILPRGSSCLREGSLVGVLRDDVEELSLDLNMGVMVCIGDGGGGKAIHTAVEYKGTLFRSRCRLQVWRGRIRCTKFRTGQTLF